MPRMPSEAAHVVDVLARDDAGQAILVVEIKRGQAVDDRAAREQVGRYARQLGAAFVMLVDDERIVVAPVSENIVAWVDAVTLSTRDVVTHYSPGKAPATLEGFFLETLIQGWLRDFSFGWHSGRPPGFDELTALGLARQLRRDTDVVTGIAV
jgi:hypothetical protein